MADKTTSVSLEERVQKLENWLKIAVGVAVVFGISGAWGFSLLQAAQKQLTALQDGIHTVKQQRDEALSDVKAAKDAGIADLKNEKAAQLLDIQAKAKPLVKDAITQEMAQQIGAARKWTAYVFSTATGTGLPSSGANGYWQKALIDQNALVQKELQ